MPVLDKQEKEILTNIANTIRHLSIDAVETAGSGHAGLPLGCAELGAYLYGYYMNYHSLNPQWINRDRFILSAGHGSILQYACLCLAGFDLSINDIKKFRQGGSKTPSHPQCGLTEGVETTTGADGHGVANGIGQALGLKILEKKFSQDEFSFFNSKVIILAGDGCIMEGLSAEASSLAGHLNLNNLILIFDSNKTSLDGYVDEIISENIPLRYQSYGWDVKEIDGHNLDEIHEAFQKTREHQTKPLLIIAHTINGRGMPQKQGTPAAHSQPLGKEAIQEFREFYHLPDQDFYVSPEVITYFQERKEKQSQTYHEWNQLYQQWKDKYPPLAQALQKMAQPFYASDLEKSLTSLVIDDPLPTRFASREVINFLADQFANLYGGSADLARSDGTFLEKYPVILSPHYVGRNIKYGVREFAMGCMAIGLSQTGYIVPFIGTFLAFSDYMRHAIRMAALMKTKIIFQFSHDSIFVAEDGPTHQPIEHFASLRTIPNLQVIRPADQNEVKRAWIAALTWNGPTALILSRQPLAMLQETDIPYDQGMGRGGYILKKEQAEDYDYCLFGTGSEVDLCLRVAQSLEEKGYHCRVVSIPCWEIFERQSAEYKTLVLGTASAKKVSIEAGVGFGWAKYIGTEGVSISVEQFGETGSLNHMQEKYNFTVEGVLKQIL